MIFDLAVERALDRLADPPRQMDVGRVDRDPRGVLLDADDPVERVLILFDFLLVARQAKHLLPVLCGEGTGQRHDAGGKFVVDPPAHGTQLFDSVRSPCQPLPAGVVVDGAALRTDRPLVQLLLPLIGIEDVVLLGVSGDPAEPRPAGAALCELFSYETPSGGPAGLRGRLPRLGGTNLVEAFHQPVVQVDLLDQVGNNVLRGQVECS